jgi:hypothetical protein
MVRDCLQAIISKESTIFALQATSNYRSSILIYLNCAESILLWSWALEGLKNDSSGPVYKWTFKSW